MRRTQTLQSGSRGGGAAAAAGDNLPVDFQFMTSFCSLFHFATEAGCVPRLIPNSVTNSEMVGILGGLINRFPSCQYCCVDIASHSTSPISPDRAFSQLQMCAGSAVSELLRCILVSKSYFAYSHCIPFMPSAIPHCSSHLFNTIPVSRPPSPCHPFHLITPFFWQHAVIYLSLSIYVDALAVLRKAGRQSHRISTWHVAYCREPPGHATVTHFYPC